MAWWPDVINAIFPLFQDIAGASLHHDRHPRVSRFPVAGRGRPISVFEIANRYGPWHAVDQGCCRCAGTGAQQPPVSRSVAQGMRRSSAITTLIVAGGEGVEAAARCGKTLNFVRALAKARRPHRQRLLRRLCSRGDRPARRPSRDDALAAHAAFSENLSASEAGARRIFVRDGDVWTSAGISAGIDLSLAMIAEDYGDEIAQKTAKQLVLYHRRSGGQSQFSSLLELKAP